jgi:O-antigen ligase
LKRVRFSTLLEAVLYILIVFTPLAFGSVHPWAYRLIDFFVFALLAFWFLQASKDGRFTYTKTPLIFFLPLACVFFVFQILPLPVSMVDFLSPGRQALRAAAGLSTGYDTLAVYPWAARGQALYLFSILAIFFLVTNHVRTREQANRIICAALGTGAVLALLAISQKAVLGRTSFLPFINKNHFAGYMEVLALMSASMLSFKLASINNKGEGLKDALLRVFSGPGAVSVVLLTFLVVFFSSSVMLTGSRGGILALLLSLIVLGGLTAKNWRQGVLLLGACSLVLIVSLSVAADNYVVRRLWTMSNFAQDSSAQFRYRVWEDTAKIAKEFPVAGVGLGGFETVYPSYKNTEAGYNVFQPENDYLYILAEGGVVGFTLVLAFCGIYIAQVASWLQKRKDAFSLGVSAGALCGLAALMLHGLADINLHIPAILLLITVLMALGYVSINSRSDTEGKWKGGVYLARKVVRTRGPVARVVLAAGGLVCIALACTSLAGAAGSLLYRSAVAEEARVTAKRAWSPNDLNLPIARLTLASLLDPGCAMYGFEKGRAYVLLAEYSAAMEAMGEEAAGLLPAEEYYSKALGCFRESLCCNPYSSFGHFMAGRALEHGIGDRNGGAEEHAAAARLNPTNRFINLPAADYDKRRI